MNAWPEGTPNPGSDDARDQGCICAVLDNDHGRSAPWPPDNWWVTEGCPLHARAASDVGGAVMTKRQEEPMNENIVAVEAVQVPDRATHLFTWLTRRDGFASLVGAWTTIEEARRYRPTRYDDETEYTLLRVRLP